MERNAISYKIEAMAIFENTGPAHRWRERMLERIASRGMKVMVLPLDENHKRPTLDPNRYPGGYPMVMPVLPKSFSGQSWEDQIKNLYFDNNPLSTSDNCVVVWDDEPEPGA